MRQGTKVGRTAGWVASLERQMVSSRAPEIAIYSCTYIYACTSFHWSSVNSLRAHSTLVLHEQTRIQVAAIRYVWTAVILSSDKTSGPFSLKITVNSAYKIFRRPKRGFEQPPSNSPCLQACILYCNCPLTWNKPDFKNKTRPY